MASSNRLRYASNSFSYSGSSSPFYFLLKSLEVVFKWWNTIFSSFKRFLEAIALADVVVISVYTSNKSRMFTF